jgi:hypothetical protein
MLCRVGPVLSIKLSGRGETRGASELVNPERSWGVILPQTRVTGFTATGYA